MKTASWKLVLIGAFIGLMVGGVITIASTMVNTATQITSYKTIIRYETKTVTTTATTTIYTTSSPHPRPCVVFNPLKDSFKINEPVTFRLINNCDEDLILPNSAPWTVKSSKGETIFSPISLQVITKIKPGSFKEWSWNQKDGKGRSVEPGIYYIEIKTSNRGTFTTMIRILGMES